MRLHCAFTVDVEDWFHILDSSVVPGIEQWPHLEKRFHIGLERILVLLDKHSIKATFFWLGWMAEKYPDLVIKCLAAGHEIASHGYAHVLAYDVGPDRFYKDLVRGKQVLEDVINHEVCGFRAAGFSTKDNTRWTFDKIAEAGFTYDSSVFPAGRGHGGMGSSPLAPYRLYTEHGELVEIPQSMIEIMGKRFSLFGGGYLRLAPWPLIRWGVRRLHRQGRPLIVYVHPREVDPEHPRLPLNPVRRFKSYVNLMSTLPKLEIICRDYLFCTMKQLAAGLEDKKAVGTLCRHKGAKAPGTRHQAIG